MAFRIKASIVFLQILFITVSGGDFVALKNCANKRSCWPQLDHEMLEVIRANMRNETQPCDNFWYHACGAWQPPLGTQHVDNFGIAIEQYEKQLQALLESNFEIEASENVTDLLSALRTYHSSCKQAKIEMHAYLAAFGELLTMNWPNWREVLQRNEPAFATNFNWLTLIAELRRFGLNDVLFKERATMAFNDARRYVIELGMPAEDESFQKKFELVNYFIEFQLADGVTDELWDWAEQIFELEQQLTALRAKHIKDDEATLEVSLSLSELKLKIPNIDWQLYFNGLLKQQHVDGGWTIELNGVGYFKEVATLLEQTDERIVGLYILMHLCKYLLEIRPQKMANHCVDHMNVVMPLGMNFMYKTFLYETRTEDEAALFELFKKLKFQFLKQINKSKLNLSAPEKRYLQEKANKMTLRLGNLPRIADSEYYNRHYDSANITNNNFHHNHLEMLSFRFRQQHFGFSKNGIKELDAETFYVYDDIVQLRSAPYFVHELNLLVVPMVFMQLPFFHHSLHALLQHSLVGFILGHEFNHAFEYAGIIMDARGNENSIGFDIRKKAEFKANVKCFQQTATQSLVERMADVNGFQLAFDAYFDGGSDDVKENDINNDEDDEVRPITASNTLENFSAQRLYFLNFAQFFCGQLPEPIDHDRDDARVNEIIRNMPEFQAAFQCSDGNEEPQKYDLCQMWR